MWIANITAVASDEIASIAKVTIEYSDGVRNKIITERISDPDSIKKIVLDGINELNRIDAINELIANPPVGEVDLSIPQPTQEQLDEQAYQQKKTAIDSGKTRFRFRTNNSNRI